jgi:penicillin-binding protein 1C
MSMLSAAKSNMSSGSIKRGGSTITMQTIRLARGNPTRTFLEKLLEACMATRLELTNSKYSIVRLYTAHAPFGGNIVGLDAASWRYFHTRPTDLSWAQSATLAVLPNSPGLIHPGRNRDALRLKRNRLLKQILDDGYISQEVYALAITEPLPDQPEPIPNTTPHLLTRLSKEAQANNQPNTRFITAISAGLQVQVNQTLEYFAQLYRGNGVNNLAAVVLSVKDGSVLAYTGNVPSQQRDQHPDVDNLASARSTGSILKPFLYAFALQDGQILPNSLLIDVPSQLAGYKPENYLTTYDGAVPARRALIRSLNVPFVFALRDYSVPKFQHNLGRLGLTTLRYSPDHYGLSLILGGAEANLVELTNAYACMARTLNRFTDENSQYAPTDFYPAQLIYQKKAAVKQNTALQREEPFVSAGAIWATFDAMRQVERPDNAGEWELFQTPRQVAWKTGTSYGFRDAWAIGVTPEYVVGVWVGNSDGEGRPGLIGLHSAAPVLFRILEQLPPTAWFSTPFDDMAHIPICRRSGNKANANCAETDSLYVPNACLRGPACTHCVLLHLDSSANYQVKAECTDVNLMRHEPWFCLPADQEYFFKLRNPWYQTPPPTHPNCAAFASTDTESQEMQLLYPNREARILVPKELNGDRGKVVLRAAHRRENARIYWHLNDTYIGTTSQFHELAVQPEPGKFQITLVDEKGQRLVRKFEVL